MELCIREVCVTYSKKNDREKTKVYKINTENYTKRLNMHVPMKKTYTPKDYALFHRYIMIDIVL